MTNAILLVSGIGMGVMYFLGYRVGRNESILLSKIESLKKNAKPEPEKPAVILSPEYNAPQQVSNVPDNRAVGLVESKTPERLEWETSQKIEKEVLGR